MKRLGGWDPDEGNDPPRPVHKEVPVTPVMKVLHPCTRIIIGLALTAGALWSLFAWEWRYVAAGLMVVLGGLIIGPWVWPQEKVRVEVDRNYRPDLGDDEVHL